MEHPHFNPSSEPPEQPQPTAESPEALSRRLERSRLLPMVRRKLLITHQIKIKKDGRQIEISNVPAQFFVSDSTDLWIELADAQGRPVGTVERSVLARCAVEWNSRSVLKTTKPLRMYPDAHAAWAGQEADSFSVIAPDAIVPVLERKTFKSADGVTFQAQKVGPPLFPPGQSSAEFPAWVVRRSEGGDVRAEFGLCVSTDEVRLFAARLELVIQNLARERAVTRRRGVREMVFALRDLSWRMFAGEWELAYTETEKELHGLPIRDNPLGMASRLLRLNPKVVIGMEERIYDRFVKQLRELQTRLRKRIQSSRSQPRVDRLSLNPASLQESPNMSWMYLSRTELY